MDISKSVQLKSYFAEKRLTQQQIADIVGSSQPVVAGLLNGTRNFARKSANKWQDAFGLSAAWLMYGTGNMMAYEEQQQPYISIHDSKVAGHDIKETNADLLQIVKSQQETIASQQADLHRLIEKVLTHG